MNALSCGHMLKWQHVVFCLPGRLLFPFSIPEGDLCGTISHWEAKSPTNSKNQLGARTNTQLHLHPFILFPVSL